MNRREFLIRISQLVAGGAVTALFPGCGSSAPGGPSNVEEVSEQAGGDGKRLLSLESFTAWQGFEGRIAVDAGLSSEGKSLVADYWSRAAAVDVLPAAPVFGGLSFEVGQELGAVAQEVKVVPPVIKILEQRGLTPQMLSRAGVMKKVNGGEMMILFSPKGSLSPKIDFYLKMGTEGTLLYDQIPQSIDAWRAAWTYSGIDPAVVKQIDWFPALIEGRQYKVLSVPSLTSLGGKRLDVFYAETIQSLGEEAARKQVGGMVVDFYQQTLLPLARDGVFLNDLQGKNLFVVGGRIAPIDVTSEGRLIEFPYSERLTWERLAAGTNSKIPYRPKQVPLPLPAFEQIPGASSLGGGYARAGIEIGGVRYQAIFSLQHEGVVSSREFAVAVTEAAKNPDFQRRFSQVNRGAVIPLEVDFQGKRISFLMQKCGGLAAPAYNQRLASLLESASKWGQRLGYVLVALGLAAEAIRGMGEPYYEVEIEADASFGQELDDFFAGRRNDLKLVSGDPEKLFENLNYNRERVVKEIMGQIRDGKTPTERLEPFLNVSAADVLRMVTEYGMSIDDLEQIFLERVKVSPVAARITASVCAPALLAGALRDCRKIGTGLSLSAMTLEGTKTIIVWQSGSTEEEAKAILALEERDGSWQETYREDSLIQIGIPERSLATAARQGGVTSYSCQLTPGFDQGKVSVTCKRN